MLRCTPRTSRALAKPAGIAYARAPLATPNAPDPLRAIEPDTSAPLLSILLSVLPIFLLVGLGYGAVRLGYLPGSVGAALNTYAVRLAVPLLMFRAMSQLDLGAAFSPPVLASFYAGSFACFVIGIVLARAVFGRRPGESVSAGFSATYINGVLLGLPIIERVYGADALTLGLGIIALQAPLIYGTGMVTMELMRRDGRPLGETLRRAARSVVTNAIMIGILSGLAVNVAGFTVPGPIATTADLIATSAIPVALIGIGASLIGYRLTAALPETMTVAALSLVLHPLLALILTHYVLGLPPIAVHVTVAMAALPPGVNVYVFATMYDRAVGLAASALLLATAAAVATITLWLYISAIIVPI